MTQIITAKATPAKARRIARILNALDVKVDQEIQNLAEQDLLSDDVAGPFKETVQQLVDNNLIATLIYDKRNEKEAYQCLWTAAEILNVETVSIIVSTDAKRDISQGQFDIKVFDFDNKLEALDRSHGLVIAWNAETEITRYFKHQVRMQCIPNNPFLPSVRRTGPKDKHIRNTRLLNEVESIVHLKIEKK